MKFDRCDQMVFSTSRLTAGSPQVKPPACTGTEEIGTSSACVTVGLAGHGDAGVAKAKEGEQRRVGFRRAAFQRVVQFGAGRAVVAVVEMAVGAQHLGMFDPQCGPGFALHGEAQVAAAFWPKS